MNSEVRNNPDGTLDEIFAVGRIHLEQMDHDHWWLGIYTAQGDLTVDLCSNRKGLFGTRVDAIVEGQFGKNDHGQSLEYSDRRTWASSRGLLLNQSLIGGGLLASGEGHWFGARDVMAVVDGLETDKSELLDRIDILCSKIRLKDGEIHDLVAYRDLLVAIIQDDKEEQTNNEPKKENSMGSEMYLGKKCKDRVSGFEGRITGYHTWLTGCDTVSVQPPIDNDGKMRKSEAFDVNRIDLLEDEPVKIETDLPPGGPQDTPSPTHGQA